MRRHFLPLLIAAALAAGAAPAAAPETSLRPEARGTAGSPRVNVLAVVPGAGFRTTLAEKLYFSLSDPSPAGSAMSPTDAGGLGAAVRSFAAAASPQAVGAALRPVRRTKSFVQKAMARQREQRESGGLCGIPGLDGEEVGYVPGRLDACGISNGVRVRAVSGVTLSQAALLDCGTASALKRWVDSALKPSVGSVGGGVAEIRVAAHYICRTRNNQPGAKVSEHGKGRAIDISAIRLRDGTNLTVLGGYRSANQGPILRRMYDAACGIFGTTLGPDSDRYHQDHFHFDTARYRSGSYCP